MTHSKAVTTQHREHGMTLIGLILGIALSSVSMLAATHMLSSHQTAVIALQNSIVHNRLLVTALSTIQKQIQSAGYGIADADQSHVVTQFDAGNSSNPAMTSIMWRYIDDNTTECRAITESGFIIDGTETRMLRLLQATTDCNENTPLVNMSWNKSLGNLGQWQVRNELLAYINANETLFSFTLTETDCSAPGLTQTAPHISAAFSAPDSAQLDGHAPSPNNFNVCLLNIHPT